MALQLQAGQAANTQALSARLAGRGRWSRPPPPLRCGCGAPLASGREVSLVLGGPRRSRQGVSRKRIGELLHGLLERRFATLLEIGLGGLDMPSRRQPSPPGEIVA